MWVGCLNPDHLTCISRNDHLFLIVLPFEVVLIWLSMTQLSTCFTLFQASLNSLFFRNIEQRISFRTETPFAEYFLTGSTISCWCFGFTAKQECWPKCFTDTFSPDREKSQNFVAPQGVLLEWKPALLQGSFRLNCIRLTFLNSVRYEQFLLWYSTQPTRRRRKDVVKTSSF